MWAMAAPNGAKRSSTNETLINQCKFLTETRLHLAADPDPGFEPAMFAEVLHVVTRLPAAAFEPYKLTADEVEALCVRLLAWAEEIEAGNSRKCADQRFDLAAVAEGQNR
jgi:hypothetical protein